MGGRSGSLHEIADVQKARVEALVADGLSVRDIAEETGIPKSTVHRIKKAMGLSTDAQ
jgi:transposase